MLEMTESEFDSDPDFFLNQEMAPHDKQVLLPPNEIQFLMGYCDLLIKPDLIKISFSKFKIFHMHITIDAEWLL